MAPREDWRSRVEALGFDFHSLGGTYWVEDAAYAFDWREIDRIEAATADLHAMCLQVADDVVAAGDYAPLGLDNRAAELVERSWRAREPALYGRMDLAYDGHGAPKLLEYNADTPTALFEASVVQWYWLEDRRAATGEDIDQFNALHERLVDRWRELLPAGARLHFAGCLDAPEDRGTVDYLMDTCLQAGFAATTLDMASVGWLDGRFVGLRDEPIDTLFKLYPWEWMLEEPFAAHLPVAPTRWIEPAWKQVLSNKSLLPLLWQRFRGHPNLLPASHDPRDIDGPTVAKPRFGREGEGIHLSDRPMVFAEPGMVYQARTPLFASDAGFALLGSWVVGNVPAGLGIREDDTAITRDTSRFVPHWFD